MTKRLAILIAVLCAFVAFPAVASASYEGRIRFSERDWRAFQHLLRTGNAFDFNGPLDPVSRSVGPPGSASERSLVMERRIREATAPKQAATRRWLMHESQRLGFARPIGFTGIAALGALAFGTGWLIGTEGYKAFTATTPADYGGESWLPVRRHKSAFPNSFPALASEYVFIAYRSDSHSSDYVRQVMRCQNGLGGWWSALYAYSCPASYPTLLPWTHVGNYPAASGAGTPFIMDAGDGLSNRSDFWQIVALGTVEFDVPPDQLTQPEKNAATEREEEERAKPVPAPSIIDVKKGATAPGLSDAQKADRDTAIETLRTPDNEPDLDGWIEGDPSGESGVGDAIDPGPNKTGPADPTDPNQCDIWLRPKLDASPLMQPTLAEQFPFGVPLWGWRILKQLEGSAQAPAFSIPFSLGELEFTTAQAQSVVNVIRPLLLIIACIGFVFLLASYAFGSGGGGGKE